MKCPGHYFTAVAATQQMFPRELLKALWVKTCLVPLAPRSRMLLADIPALIPVGWRRAITNTPPCEHHVELNAGAPAGVSFRVPAGLLEGNWKNCALSLTSHRVSIEHIIFIFQGKTSRGSGSVQQLPLGTWWPGSQNSWSPTTTHSYKGFQELVLLWKPDSLNKIAAADG